MEGPLPTAYGAVTLNAAGDGFVYTAPATRDEGTRIVTFRYRAVDPDGLPSEPAGVSVTIPGTGTILRSYVANDDTFTIDEDATLSGADLTADNGNGIYDLDGAALADVEFAESNLSAGSLVLDTDTGVFDYTPPPDFAGDVMFSYRIFDGVSADTANVTITVVPVNDLPVANDDRFDLTPDQVTGGLVPLAVLRPGQVLDVDDALDDLTVVLETGLTPARGTLALNGAGTGFVYTAPDSRDLLDTSETITFTYRARDDDGALSEAPATVTLTLPPRGAVGAAFVMQAEDDTFTIAEDTPLTGANVRLANGGAADDLDGAPLASVAFAALKPSTGVLTFDVDTGIFDVNPTENENGPVTFEYTLFARDGASSDTAQVTDDGQFAIDDNGQITVATNDLKPGTFNLTVLSVNDAGQLDGNGNSQPNARGFFPTRPGPESMVTIVVTAESPVARADQTNEVGNGQGTSRAPIRTVRGLAVRDIYRWGG